MDSILSHRQKDVRKILLNYSFGMSGKKQEVVTSFVTSSHLPVLLAELKKVFEHCEANIFGECEGFVSKFFPYVTFCKLFLHEIFALSGFELLAVAVEYFSLLTLLSKIN